MLLPLVLAQFVCSYAASNMNVAISNIAKDLGTSVYGVQTAITVFTLTMAALMIPGSKLTDIWGRKRCFLIGLYIYGAGAIIAALAQGIGLLTFGYSILEGVGSALLIPPVYILATVFFDDVKSRAKAFGRISAMAGIGAAAGPLVGGLITTAFSWRASFIAQAALVAFIILLSRRITDPIVNQTKPKFDLWGAILSAASLFFIVTGILQIKVQGPVWFLLGIGALLMGWFFLHIRSLERANREVSPDAQNEPLLSTRLFRSTSSNLGLITQLLQWFLLLGSSFVISVFFQTVRGFNAIETGLVLTPATIGLLLTSLLASRLAKKFSQKMLIVWGFIITISGLVVNLFTTSADSSVWASVPGLFIMGMGIGLMLTSSVNVVQSSFSEKEQGEISGLSRSVSNLGSSLGTAIAGTVLIAAEAIGNRSYGLALVVLALGGLIGLIVSFFIPKEIVPLKEN